MIEKKVYANPKQIKFLRSRAKRKTFHGGRGSGKTDTLGKVVGMAFDRMSRAKFVLAGLTYVQLDLVVLPVIKESLEYMGIFEYSKKNAFGVYVVGIKPPDHWDRPYKAVGRLGYQYCMSFINGFTVQFVSQDRPETHRGLNFDGLLNDEAATMEEDFVSKVLKKGLRGNIYKKFSGDSLFHCHFDFSSASWTQEGMHIYKTEQLWQEEFDQRKLWSQEDLEKTSPGYLFLEATCLDNPLLGQDYYERQKAESDPLEFEVEVENKRMTTRPDGFYNPFRTATHCYFQGYSYQHDDKTGLVLWQSNDYHNERPLEVSLDFNAAITWCLVCQEVGRDFRVVNSKYTKPTLEQSDKGIVVQTAEWFCDTYDGHSKKEVYVYGDPGGNSKTANTSKSNQPFFEEFCGVLKKRGWIIFRRELVSYPRHKDKYALMKLLFEESSERTPRIRINQIAGCNKAFILALRNARTLNDDYEKDKNSERQARNREQATDSTDALDYIAWAKYRKLLPTRQLQRNQVYIYKK